MRRTIELIFDIVFFPAFTDGLINFFSPLQETEKGQKISRDWRQHLANNRLWLLICVSVWLTLLLMIEDQCAHLLLLSHLRFINPWGLYLNVTCKLLHLPHHVSGERFKLRAETRAVASVGLTLARAVLHPADLNHSSGNQTNKSPFPLNTHHTLTLQISRIPDFVPPDISCKASTLNDLALVSADSWPEQLVPLQGKKRQEQQDC